MIFAGERVILPVMEPGDSNSSTGDTQQPKEFNNLLDFVYDPDRTEELEIEVTITEDGRVAIFHNKPFMDNLSWIEYDMDRQALEFILDDGKIRNIGVPVRHELSPYIQNTHQVLMILMNDEDGEAKEGYYVPLIVHKL